jgi:hypothetical protein
MEEKRRNDLAADRAEKYAPRPTGGAVMAGATGAGLLLAADAVIAGFYGWRLRDHLLLLSILMGCGFLLGLFVFLRLNRLNRRARHAERMQIDLDAQNDSSTS